MKRKALEMLPKFLNTVFLDDQYSLVEICNGIHVPVAYSQLICCRIVGNSSGKNFSQIGAKYNFLGENFCRLLACAAKS